METEKETKVKERTKAKLEDLLAFQVALKAMDSLVMSGAVLVVVLEAKIVLTIILLFATFIQKENARTAAIVHSCILSSRKVKLELLAKPLLLLLKSTAMLTLVRAATLMLNP